jgi:hypothetical protein
VTVGDVADRPTGGAPARTIVQADGRAKAYRPLSRAKRRAAVADGLAAYERGDFFLAHELMEPAWMGTADPVERALVQGLIKLAAADVHGVRGNPRGVIRNLEGALGRLRHAHAATTPGRGGAPVADDLDLAALIETIEIRLRDAADASLPPTSPVRPTPLPRSRP